MTVITRNRLFLLSRILSFCVYITNIGFFIYSFINKSFCAPCEVSGSGFILFRYSFCAVIISIFVFLFYTLITQFFVFDNFARTRATEVLFFSTFLLGCLSETFRFFLPIQGLASSFSIMYIVLGQAIIFGRILCPLSLLFIALMSEPEQRLNEERNLTVIIFVAMIFCSRIPVNSTVITKFCIFKWGYSSFITMFRILVISIAALSLFINTDKADFSEANRMSLGFTIMSLGYLILCETDNFAKLTAGTVFLAAGTYQYLLNLHKKYLWI